MKLNTGAGSLHLDDRASRIIDDDRLASSADEAGAAYYVAEAELWVADAGGTP